MNNNPKPQKKWFDKYKEITDSDIMPFGMHKGTKMEDVPDSYLLGLYQKLKDDSGIYPDSMADRVREYIKDNLDSIEKNVRHTKGKF